MIKEILNTYHPRGLINFAAETHVDNSIKSPDKFIRSNIIGTYTLLKEIKTLYETSSSIDRKNFRFFCRTSILVHHLLFIFFTAVLFPDLRLS